MGHGKKEVVLWKKSCILEEIRRRYDADPNQQARNVLHFIADFYGNLQSVRCESTKRQLYGACQETNKRGPKKIITPKNGKLPKQPALFRILRALMEKENSDFWNYCIADVAQNPSNLLETGKQKNHRQTYSK